MFLGDEDRYLIQRMPFRVHVMHGKKVLLVQSVLGVLT